jgi:hypothetical protein
MEQSFKCACGHTQSESGIHSIESVDSTKIYDLCEDCFCAADLVENPLEGTNLAHWKFASLPEQEKYALSHSYHRLTDEL